MRSPGRRMILQHRASCGVHMTTALHIVCPHCDAINRLPRERLRDGAKCGSCHRPLYEGRPAALDSVARFDRHATHSDIPLLVDFWAIWCGHCREIARKSGVMPLPQRLAWPGEHVDGMKV